MTRIDERPVFDGRMVKWTLERQQANAPGLVRIDWLRFTLPLDAVCKRSPSTVDLKTVHLLERRARDLVREGAAADADEVPGASHVVATVGAQEVARRLGVFELGTGEEKGLDFYTSRRSLLFNGEAVGMVLAGGRSDNQASTVHVNLFGSALLHVDPAALRSLADWIEEEGGWITRCDLALDVWTGADVKGIRSAYLAGEFDVRGKRPTQREIGSWTLGHSRTFEVGSRATGKLFRGYEKGDELLGHEAGDPWVRYEVELRNNHRVIDPDVLREPADFFAGAYPFLARELAERQALHSPRVIPTQSEVKDKTTEAVALRVARWVKTTAAPSICALLELGGDLLLDIVDRERGRMPGRFRGHSPQALRVALHKVAAAFAPPSAPSMVGA